jgi:uncharacterized protein (TIGR03084 family)
MTATTANDIALDLLEEYRELAALCDTLTAEQWSAPSAFYGWTPWDEIAHLCYFDEAALQSVREPERFPSDAARLNARIAGGEEFSSIQRATFGHLDGAALLALWRTRHEALARDLAALDPKARLRWYGPPMSARSFASARLMETWAHGQDVWDVAHRRRPATARLKHIAHLGVTTFGWTFANRGLRVPDVVPHVVLRAPDGSIWQWGDAGSAHRVNGSAEDFCLLVTQRRHVDDTALQYSDGPVRDWLQIAQCFAGPPADGPKPGVRKLVVAE